MILVAEPSRGKDDVVYVEAGVFKRQALKEADRVNGGAAAADSMRTSLLSEHSSNFRLFYIKITASKSLNGTQSYKWVNGVKWFGPPSLVPAPCTPGEWAEYTVSHTTPAIADFGESGSYFIEKYVFWFSL